MRTCPRCTLVSPDAAIKCDCGFEFATKSRSELDAEVQDARARAKREISTGILLTIGAGGFSIASFLFAQPGGWFIIAHGAVAAGVLMVIRGLSTRRSLANWEKES